MDPGAVGADNAHGNADRVPGRNGGHPPLQALAADRRWIPGGAARAGLAVGGALVV